MIEKHRAQLRALDDEATSLIADLLSIPPDEPLLVPALEARDLCQADVVMALLRAPPGQQSLSASLVLGKLTHLIKHQCERPWPRPLPKTPQITDPDEWWVASRKRDLWLERVGDFGKWADRRRKKTRSLRVQLGMTVRGMLAAGVARAAISDARRRGLLRLSSTPRPGETTSKPLEKPLAKPLAKPRAIHVKNQPKNYQETSSETHQESHP